MQTSLQQALEQLAQSDQPFVEMMKHGSMSVELYVPQKVDLQEPHQQDELYVVISGKGTFINGDTSKPFQTGDVLFVPAGVVHRFEDFSDDFKVWVIFYGNIGGE